MAIRSRPPDGTLARASAEAIGRSARPWATQPAPGRSHGSRGGAWPIPHIVHLSMGLALPASRIPGIDVDVRLPTTIHALVVGRLAEQVKFVLGSWTGQCQPNKQRDPWSVGPGVVGLGARHLQVNGCVAYLVVPQR